MADYLDSWRASTEEMLRKLDSTKRRLRRFQDRVQIVRATSAAASELFADESLDFVYIDANHAYLHVLEDLRLWTPKVRSGGLVAGHDYFDAIPDEKFDPIPTTKAPPESLTSYGVKSALDTFVREQRLQLRTTEERWPTWYISKT